MGKWQTDKDGWNTKKGGSGNGASFLQAALEGAVVSALGLANFSGKGGGKGKGKNSGTPPKKKTFCRWKDCTAAQQQKPTLGDKAECFSCGKHFCTPPPIEKLAEWAYAEQLAAAPPDAAKTAKDKGKAAGALKSKVWKGAGKGGPPPKTAAAPPANDDAAEAALRKKRLEELKVAKAGTPPATVQEEVDKSYCATEQEKGAPKPLVLTKELIDSTALMADNAAAVIRSLQAESLPASSPLENPEATLKRLLATSAPFTADDKRATAEAGLNATKASIAALIAGDTASDDEILMLLKTRMTRQEAELGKWGQTATPARRRQALVIAKEDYDGLCISRGEAQQRGAEKALARAKERTELLKNLGGAVGALQEAAEEAVVRLTLQHEARTLAKKKQREAVRNLIGQRLAEIDDSTDSDATFVDAAVDDAAPQTVTETDLLNSRAVAGRMRQQIQQLQDALALAEAAPAAPAAPAEPATLDAALDEAAQANAVKNNHADLWINFAADITMLPKFDGVPTEAQLKGIGALGTLFAAVPWGSPLPAVTFDQIGVHPAFVHTLVGDAMWEDCWQHRHTAITGEHYVPFQLSSLIKFAVEAVSTQLNLRHTAEEELGGRVRYDAVKQAAEQRRSRGSPY